MRKTDSNSGEVHLSEFKLNILNHIISQSKINYQITNYQIGWQEFSDTNLLLKEASEVF